MRCKGSRLAVIRVLPRLLDGRGESRFLKESVCFSRNVAAARHAVMCCMKMCTVPGSTSFSRRPFRQAKMCRAMCSRLRTFTEIFIPAHRKKQGPVRVWRTGPTGTEETCRSGGRRTRRRTLFSSAGAGGGGGNAPAMPKGPASCSGIFRGMRPAARRQRKYRKQSARARKNVLRLQPQPSSSRDMKGTGAMFFRVMQSLSAHGRQ